MSFIRHLAVTLAAAAVIHAQQPAGDKPAEKTAPAAPNAPANPPPDGTPPPPPEGGPGQQPGRGGFGGGGFGGMMRSERKLVKQFDKDGDKRLNTEERKAAREFVKKENANGGGGGRRGGPGGGPGFFLGGPGGGQNQDPPKPGPRVAPADVKPAASSSLYAPNELRTLFLDFEGSDWESEISDFHNTDVEVPATMTVDGEKYPAVGVHFRGASSYMMVREGRKRSLNLSLDYADKKQRLDGYKTLNLLNSNGDESMMSTVLYTEIAKNYIPVPKANYVKVVINGESWGVYVNVQQFNKDFVQENFRTEKGARWKVKGSPGGGGGLTYIGEDIAKYKEHYELKTDENDEDWKALIALCRTLKETPPEKLEEALKPQLEIDGLLWFLALDNTLINTDGYWIRDSDYNIYRDKTGKFHILPHDMNESFTTPHGPGMRRRGQGGGPGGGGAPGGQPPVAGANANGAPTPPAPGAVPPQGAAAAAGATPAPGGPEGEFRPPFAGGPGGPGGGAAMPAVKGVELDPLVGLDDARKPLRGKVLAVPALRERYLAHVRTIAQDWLDWNKLGPIVARYRALIEKDVEIDTRKLGTFAAFQKATANEPAPAPAKVEPEAPKPTPNAEKPASESAKPAEAAQPGPRRGPGGGMSLRQFADQRRAYLLSLPAVRDAKP